MGPYMAPEGKKTMIMLNCPECGYMSVVSELPDYMSDEEGVPVTCLS